MYSLVDGYMPKGESSLYWHGVDDKGNKLPSGVYFYRLKSGKHQETKKMTLLK